MDSPENSVLRSRRSQRGISMIEMTIATIGRLMKNLAIVFIRGRTRQGQSARHRVLVPIPPQLCS